jgi:RHS repeat-associated protein
MTPPLACLLSAAPDMPPHSTGKERDQESQLDYFGARYYASSIGRFMSPDWSAKVEPVPYAKLGNPQSLNLYSYVWNNPLSRNDPDGHYTCADGAKCDSANDKAFQGRLDNLKAAQGTFKEGSKEYKQIGKILSAYGGAGDTKTANGKTVSIGFSGGANTGGETRAIDKGTIGVSLASNFSEQSSGNNVGTTVLVGHEGQHVVDGAPTGTARFGSEMRAESVSQTILNGLAPTSVMPSNMDSFSIRGITTWQRGGDPNLGGAPYDPGAAFRIAVQDYKEDVQNDPK